MAGKREVAQDERHLTRELLPKFLHHRIGGSTSFAFEIEELDDGDRTVAGVIQDVTVTPSGGCDPRHGIRFGCGARLLSLSEEDNDHRDYHKNQPTSGCECDFSIGLQFYTLQD